MTDSVKWTRSRAVGAGSIIQYHKHINNNYQTKSVVCFADKNNDHFVQVYPKAVSFNYKNLKTRIWILLLFNAASI